jgi:hypothetical protein
MRSQLGGVALLLVLSACGDEPSAPGDLLLLGQWGVAGESPAQLIGLRVAAELQFPCSSVGTNEPVGIDHNGHFTFFGRLHTSGISSGSREAQVRGHVEGEHVRLTVDVRGDGVVAQTLTLQAGVDPAFEDLPPTCPLEGS